MSILIENDLIYLAVPKTGCVSITNAIIKSNLNYELAPTLKKEYNKHNEHISLKDSEFNITAFHYRLDELKQEFGNKKTISIKRNYLDRFISAMGYCYHKFRKMNIEPKIYLDKLNNERIYKLIDDEFVFLVENRKFVEVLKYFSDDDNYEEKDLEFLYSFVPSSHMKSGYKVEYEFDISELHLLEKFLNDRYQSNVNIKKLNVSTDNKSSVIKNMELNNFIWDKFEKKYNNKSLI